MAGGLQQPSPSSLKHSYADVLRSSPPPPARDVPCIVAPVTPIWDHPYGTQAYRPPRPVETRTCFYCGIRGHIARFCRRRRRDEASFSDAQPRFPPRGQPFNTDYQQNIPYHPDPRYHDDTRTSSPPPRRRSLSPAARRSALRPPRRTSPGIRGNP